MVDTSNKIQCEICKLWYKQITSTHLKQHEITLSEYKNLYPNSPIVSSEISQKLIKANEKKWSDPEYKEKVANTISKVIKNQWKDGKYHRIQSKNHKTKRVESRRKTYEFEPERFMGININPEIDQFVEDNIGKHFCQCGCGEEIQIERYHYSTGIPKFKYNHHHLKGEKNPNYNFNITNEERILCRNYPEYIQWRKDVYKRDNYTCQICNQLSHGDLNAHHIENYANNKELRTILDNGITLCESCHKDFHHIYGIKNNTKEQFIEFKNRMGDLICQ